MLYRILPNISKAIDVTIEIIFPIFCMNAEFTRQPHPNQPTTTMKPNCYPLVGALVLTLSIATSARANTFTEGTDVGNTEATAVVLPAGTTQINGTLAAGTTNHFGVDPVDVDVYCFTVTETVPMNAIQVTAAFNTNILILREGFFGMEGQDGGGLSSTLSVLLPPGTYYIAVGRNNIAAFPAGSTIPADAAWDNDTGQVPGPEQLIPIAFIGSRDADPDDTAGDAYSVTMDLGGVAIAVTGIDQAAGKKLKKLKGFGILNNSGRKQTTKVNGGNSGRFNVLMRNSGETRKTLTTIKGNASRLDFKVIAIGNGRKNVTAKLLAKGYKANVASGDSIRFKVSVRKGDAPNLRKKFLLRTIASGNKRIRDTAGAKLNLK